MAAADTELEGVAETAVADAAVSSELLAAPATTPPAPGSEDPPVPSEGKQKAAKKQKKDSKKKPGKGDEAADGDPGGPSVAAHPRAARGVARAKAWGGLAGFVLGGYLSLPTHTVADAGLRALIAGMVCYVAVWAAAVFVWRRLVMLELRARQQQLAAGAPAGASSTRNGAPGAQGPGGEHT